MVSATLRISPDKIALLMTLGFKQTGCPPATKLDESPSAGTPCSGPVLKVYHRLWCTGNLKYMSHVLHRLKWIEQGLTSHSTHFTSFRRRWSDCGISPDCSRSQSPQCVRCWVVCARPLLITDVEVKVSKVKVTAWQRHLIAKLLLPFWKSGHWI